MSLATVPSWLLSLYAAIVGLIVGSFLNVVIHRLPRQISTVRPRSRCPYCGGAIRVRDNVPVLSWVLLRGVSVVAVGHPSRLGTLWSRPWWQPSSSPASRPSASPGPRLAAAVFCCLLLVLAAIDLEHFLLPDSITLPGIVVGWHCSPGCRAPPCWTPSSAALVGAGVLILLINVWFWLRDEESMGLGDVNMLAMIGAFLGWQGVASTLSSPASVGRSLVWRWWPLGV